MTQPTIVVVPGRGNSGTGHWQTLLENRIPGTLRVHQDNWDSPILDAWSLRIDDAVRRLDHRPLVIAHSFGCLATAHAQITLGTPIGATLFVAPANPERFGLPPRIFYERLPQPGFMVASNNDPWMPHDRAIALATAWGISSVTLRNAGHINIDSGHGDWPYGEALVEVMRRKLGQTETFPRFEPIFFRPANPVNRIA